MQEGKQGQAAINLASTCQGGNMNCPDSQCLTSETLVLPQFCLWRPLSRSPFSPQNQRLCQSEPSPVSATGRAPRHCGVECPQDLEQAWVPVLSRFRLSSFTPGQGTRDPEATLGTRQGKLWRMGLWHPSPRQRGSDSTWLLHAEVG